jgi:uncharacterized protein
MTYFHLLLFFLPGVLLAMYAQIKLRSAYSRYIKVAASSGMSGAQAARMILDHAGLPDMPVKAVPGQLTDHYDPIRKTLCLSQDNFQGRSLAAVGVAAHEAGHALQHKASYAPLQLRMALVPVTGFASQAVFWILLLGMIMQFPSLISFAVILFGIITLFQVITLPVEFDASRRAKEQLLKLGIVQSGESAGVSKVLNAAAMTYVAAMLQALLTFLYYLMILRGSSRG